MRARPGPWIGAAILALVGLCWALSAVSGYDVIADVDPTRAGQGPSAGHWLGTDPLGRDVGWRLVFAARSFAAPAAGAGLLAVALAVPLGAAAGYLGGLWARLIRLGLTSLASLPRLVLALLLATLYGGGPVTLAFAAGLAAAPALAEAVAGRVGGLARAEFVVAARAHGLSHAAILGRHLLWVNCRRLVGRHLLQIFSFTLILETTLSYLGGYGVLEPAPSWGNMLAFSFGYGDNPLASVAPATALWLAALGAHLAGAGLAEGPRD